MADKTYKMTVGLSNGTILDAGTFVAPQGPQGLRGATGPQGPQGPQGPEGPAGGIGKWEEITNPVNAVIPDGTYLIKVDNMVALTEIYNGSSSPILFMLSISTNNKRSAYTFGQFVSGGFSRYWKTTVIVEESGAITFNRELLDITNLQIINLV